MWLNKAHVGLALLSVTLFFIRGLWMIADSPLRQTRPVKIAPHIIDTLLLISAIVLIIQTQQYPWEHSWLAAKIIALLAYIALGLVAMRLGRSKQIRIFAWLLALATFGYMFLVAIQRNPLPLLS